ncbi:MAG TPA: FHA domain-containing protein [Rhodanobacteraceae bacterium]|nr:FHA domain-containing protein [Rhodanobacteraceae bacterium]
MACGPGPIRIGSAPGDDIVLTSTGVERHHATLESDPRGLVLTVTPGCPRVYVNARAVRERALLHYGDTLTFGGSKLRITSDAAPAEGTDQPPATQDVAIGPVLLRIVSGPDSGRAMAVEPELHLGAGTRHFGELPYACRIERASGCLLFESEGAQPRINGWHCKRAVLGAGDQITLGEHRLVVEAPGLQYAARMALLPAAPVPAAEASAPPESAQPSQIGIWGLLVAAAVVAAVIALILYFPL